MCTPLFVRSFPPFPFPVSSTFLRFLALYRDLPHLFPPLPPVVLSRYPPRPLFPRSLCPYSVAGSSFTASWKKRKRDRIVNVRARRRRQRAGHEGPGKAWLEKTWSARTSLRACDSATTTTWKERVVPRRICRSSAQVGHSIQSAAERGEPFAHFISARARVGGTRSVAPSTEIDGRRWRERERER